MSPDKDFLGLSYIYLLYPLTFLAFFFLFIIIIDLIFPQKTALKEQLKIYDRKSKKIQDKRVSKITSSLPVFITKAILFLVKRGGIGEEIRLRLEQAGVPFRVSEFVFLHVLGVTSLGLLGYLWMKSWATTILLIGFGATFPLILLGYLKKKRINQFQLQLPETLSLIAGALKAGYSFLQAVEMVVEETKPPISSEFAKVLTETRLGLPLEQALDHIATRISSIDLNWSIMAVKIQKEVGGNLAEVLEILADTLRERVRLFRQIKALTAEGRLSALILFILPFALSLILYILNPKYLGILFDTSPGKIMVIAAGVMMIIGGLWLKKVISVEF